MKPDEVTIYVGQLRVSRQPLLLRTVLGSCIAVCLHDPQERVGGMNHFLLPGSAPTPPGRLTRPPGALGLGTGEADEPSRFGVHAMELLISGLQRLGGDRRRLRAKIFGGGHILQGMDQAAGASQRNVRFILSYMNAERIPVVSQDLGGTRARRVLFYTDTGKAFVKRLGQTEQQAARLAHEEQEIGVRSSYGPIILFAPEEGEYG